MKAALSKLNNCKILYGRQTVHYYNALGQNEFVSLTVVFLLSSAPLGQIIRIIRWSPDCTSGSIFFFFVVTLSIQTSITQNSLFLINLKKRRYLNEYTSLTTWWTQQSSDRWCKCGHVVVKGFVMNNEWTASRVTQCSTTMVQITYGPLRSSGAESCSTKLELKANEISSGWYHEAGSLSLEVALCGSLR